ncbi:hypothetical protein KI387_002696, partial [Taxus chinensis]
YLDISFKNIDNASLVVIANSASFLRHLSLVKCKFVRDMKVLSNFKALEYLNLDQRLSYLSLSLTRITDNGMPYLASCSLFRSLKIPYCRGVQGPGL